MDASRIMLVSLDFVLFINLYCQEYSVNLFSHAVLYYKACYYSNVLILCRVMFELLVVMLYTYLYLVHLLFNVVVAGMDPL